MAIYYQIKDNNQIFQQKFKTEVEVCLFIRANRISDYSVFRKDDSAMKGKKEGSVLLFPLAPMCDDVSDEIRSILDSYETKGT